MKKPRLRSAKRLPESQRGGRKGRRQDSHSDLLPHLRAPPPVSPGGSDCNQSAPPGPHAANLSPPLAAIEHSPPKSSARGESPIPPASQNLPRRDPGLSKYRDPRSARGLCRARCTPARARGDQPTGWPEAATRGRRGRTEGEGQCGAGGHTAAPGSPRPTGLPGHLAAQVSRPGRGALHGDPAYLFGRASRRSAPGTLRPSDVRVPTPWLGGACGRRVSGEGGERDIFGQRPARHRRRVEPRRSGKRGPGAGLKETV